MAADPGRAAERAEVTMPDTITSEEWRPHPERAAELEAYYREGLSFQAARTRMMNGRSRLWAALFAASAVCVAGLSAAVCGLIPAQRLIPMLLVIEPDGTVDSYSSISSLPATQEQAVIRAAIWKYVRDRESYNWADSPGRYQFVSAMSSPKVRDFYQHWFLQEFNPLTPQVVIGQKGQIDVALKSITFPYPNMVLVRYQRSLQFYDQPHALVTTWTATAEFQLSDRMPLASRDEGDPGGIVVVRYTTAQDTPTP